MTTNKKQKALIVGASRGLGLGLVNELLSRGWDVIATDRSTDPSSPLRMLAAKSGTALQVEKVDINLPATVESLKEKLKGTTLDMLFVNAGVANSPGETIAETTTEEFNRLMTTNALSPMRVIETIAPFVAPAGSIAAMSSGLASVSENLSGGYDAYRASKAALNTLLLSYGARNKERTVFAIIPGWVRTDMGGPNATLSVEASVKGIVDTMMKRKGSTGVKFVDYENKEMSW